MTGVRKTDSGIKFFGFTNLFLLFYLCSAFFAFVFRIFLVCKLFLFASRFCHLFPKIVVPGVQEQHLPGNCSANGQPAFQLHTQNGAVRRYSQSLPKDG